MDSNLFDGFYRWTNCNTGSMKREILILKGLPASGKTTFAKKFVEENEGWVRINRDDLRHMSGIYWVPSREDYISSVEAAAILNALITGHNVIVDATNLSKAAKDIVDKAVEAFTGMKEGNTVEVSEKFFDIPLPDCIARDAARENPVGERVIRSMWRKHLANSPKYAVIDYCEQDEELPSAIICDIDGTLAMMNGRSPYDRKRVGEDVVNKPIRHLLHIMIESYKCPYIIILSGREDDCIDETRQWLKDNDIPFDAIFMRKTGDHRKDAVIKKEIVESEILGKYRVEFVLDDRDQVVDMWRKELKLPCLQVNYGNF